MIRTVLFIFLGCLLLVQPANAQLMQYQQGQKYFSGGDYVKALEYFNQAISQERSGNKALLTEAYYFRGLTFIRLHGEAFSSENKESQKKYADALLLAYKDFKSSLKNDDGAYWSKIDLEVKNLHHSLLQEGLKALNEYNDQVYHGKPDPRLLTRASDYLGAAHEIRDSYLVNDLLGQVALVKGEMEEAEKFFVHSENLYLENLPDEPDFLMAYVFYRLAAIHKNSDYHQAMNDCQRGIALMESEYTRFVMMKSKLGQVRVQQMEDQYRLAMQDLNNLKLDLYISDPGLYTEAIEVFESELSKDPENVDLLIGYASLLEKSDKTKAVAVYKQVLDLQPEHSLALFNLGALHYAKGKEMFDLTQKTTQNDQYALLMEGAIESFEKSRPYFERALVQDPGSIQTIQALKTIAFILDDEPAYLKYQALEKEYSR